MNRIKYPAVAGLFYPADATTLQQNIAHYVAAAAPAPRHPPKALIAPHAGYIYSGPVAGSAYASLGSAAETISRVVILAPAHRLAFRGIAYSSASHFQTPLGLVPVDEASLAGISTLPLLQENDPAFQDEHSIEVQLPFLQTVLVHFSIVPLLVGEATDLEVAEVIEQLWGGDETLILISSDLSHYLNYHDASARDRETTQAIESLQGEKLTPQSACGCTPVRGLLRTAQSHGLRVRTLDLRNSGDTAGAHDRVVGYGAYAFN